jgi:YidC/Oxa1 family membrane protein insertase
MNNDSKRLFLAMFLTFGFLFVWTKYFGPKPAPAPAATTSTETPGVPATTNAPAAQPTQTSTTPASIATTSDIKKVANIETFETTTNDFHTTFSNQSGSIASVELLHYFQELKKDSKSVSVIPLAQPTQAPLLWNLALRTSAAAPEATATVNDQTTAYSWEKKSSDEVSFTTSPIANVTIEKFYRFTKDPFVIEHVLRLENKSSENYFVDANTSLFSSHIPKDKQKSSFLSPQNPDVQAVAYAQDEASHMKLEKLVDKNGQFTTPPIAWSGFASQYFLLAAIPTEGMWESVSGNYQNEIGSMTMKYPQRSLASNATIEYVLKLYAGPKQLEVLESAHPTLDRSIDLGSWIGGLARLIHKLLGWIYGFIPNYGWAIIILTVMVRLAVFPLAQMQARSMKRMTTHKPAMDALKEKYSKDREAYSRELMSYMRTNKINPASGCLPLLIQFPVFIALYRVLYNSIELRHAAFGFWIHDLSAHDPFFVLPVLVGITFYFQTKLNPTPMADPAQQTMMKIMPVMFSVFMIFLPSGLNLYIFVSTLWGIVQQYMVQKQST